MGENNSNMGWKVAASLPSCSVFYMHTKTVKVILRGITA